MIEFTEEQQRAIARRDRSILLSAGAGSGKTSVLVERFVRSVLDDGAEVDSILAITFTEKAAAQLKERVRARFTALGAHEAARAAEGAWISTIHGFCARLLRAHALPAGIDPEFGMLDGLGSERVAIDAFDRALGEFLGAGEDSERLRLIATYTPDRLADMVRTVYGHLRSRGQARPALPEVSAPAASGERAGLAAAATAALAEIAGADGKMVGKARIKLERCAALLARLPEAEVADAAAVADLRLTGTARVLRGPACEAYGERHEAYLAHCLRTREYLDHVLLRELLDLHGRHYEALKAERSALDFDDLELLARDLLLAEEGLREHYAERFSHLMIDEFQDTNPLQNEILELLERDNLFRVGDERQSIYRFRHADVGVFRGHREAARASGGEERISVNFRSRGEILDAIDLTFGRLWGESFEPLRERPGARAEPAPLTPCVELLVVDRSKSRWDERTAEAQAAGGDPFGSGMEAVTPWRAAEARLLARRIDELTREGPFSYRDVVVLTRVTTSMGVYERALEERGIPTHVLGGRGYWSQQQVGDLRAYLAALANPRDELALYSVLASPLAGLSLDALVLLASAARRSRGGLWRTVEAAARGESPDLPKGGDEGSAGDFALPEADLESLRAFARRFEAERSDAPRISLETLIDRAVTSSGYDRAVLAMPSGDRRMANVRKLMRMAREYEAEEGRDLRGFIDFVAERDLVQEREGEAPLEAEDLDAVRVMTIHRSKGLEFPVVCVADLGKQGREDDSALRISEDGQVGIRLASLEGGALDSATLEAIRHRQKLEDEEEERRIFYVAATRAQQHLLLSGATDLEKLHPEAPLEEPMRWLWRALAPDLAERGAVSVSALEREGRPLEVRCEVLRPATLDELLPAADRAPARREPVEPDLAALDSPALRAVPVPPALAVSRISYSGLDLYARCGYRFYLEHALGLPGGEDLAPGLTPPLERSSNELSARVRGTVVHSLLERLDLDRPEAPTAAEVAELVEAEGASATEGDLAELIGLVEAFAASPIRARVAAARRVRRELPFAFELEPGEGGGRSLLVNGVVDLHAEEEDRLLIVDYKSNRLGGRAPAQVAEAAYATQRLVYALAGLKSGAPRVEVAYVFLERPHDPVTTVFEGSEAPGLEERLLELASGVAQGVFAPSDSPCAELCADCPGQPSLCSWGQERTLASAPA